MRSTPLKFFGRLTPLPLPDKFRENVFRLSIGRQLGIALMLNLLSLAMPVMMLQVYDRIIPHQSFGTLAMLVAGVLVALWLDAALRIARAWLVGWSAASGEHAASCAAIDKLARVDLAVFAKSGTGEHMQNLNALGRLREFYSGQAMTALVDLPFVLVFLALVAYLGGILVWVPIALLLLFLASALVAGGRLRHALERRSKADDTKAGLIVSILTGIHSIKAIGMESSLLRRYEKVQSGVTKASYEVALSSALAATLSAAFGQLSLILTALAGCILVLHGALSVGGLSACTLLAGRAIQPVQRILGTWLRLQDLTVAHRQANALFAMPARVVTPNVLPLSAEGRIMMDRVKFSHPDSGKTLLRNITLTVEPGQIIAINGDKSSGKSTLLQLIAGIQMPTKGSVFVDGVNPSDYGLAEMTGRIGYLPQEGTIFRGTLLENLTGFRDDEETVEKAKEACTELGLHTIVDLLPFGFQTLLTDTAADPVPPGVKQRIALTRVLMHKPAILLFDDADRALDKEGYNYLFRLMGRLKGHCTLVMVSHDQNLLSFADRSYYLENGVLTARDADTGFSFDTSFAGKNR